MKTTHLVLLFVGDGLFDQSDGFLPEVWVVQIHLLRLVPRDEAGLAEGRRQLRACRSVSVRHLSRGGRDSGAMRDN